MSRLIIRLLAAVITFVIGLTTSLLLRFPVPQSIQPVVTDPILVRPQIQELPDWAPEPNPAQGADLSVAVAVSGADPDSPTYQLRYLKLARHGTTIVFLDLGEDLNDSEVTLYFRDSPTKYRILQRYRATMSISAEGPHLDLIDWRHFDSLWHLLNNTGLNRFRTLCADQMDVEFPKTSQADIIKEVRRRVGNDWPVFLELAKSCGGPNDGACYVGISSMYLKIQKQVGDRWIDAGFVEFQIPMGC